MVTNCTRTFEMDCVGNSWTWDKNFSKDEIIVGNCPKCGAPIYSPKMAHIVGPFPVRTTCGHSEAVQTAEFVRPRPRKIIW